MREQMRNQFLGTLIFLMVQFLLGMAVNLYVTIPTNHPGANPPEYFGGVVQSVGWAILHGHVLLQAHAILGLLLVVNALGLLFAAIRVRARDLIWVTSLGFVGVLGAGFNGGSFLNYNQDFSSMLMATFFAWAVVSYAVGIFVTGRSTAEPASAQASA
jgi:hypothetical protein